MTNNKDFNYLSKILLNCEFRFAKSMPKFPHWYTLRKDWDNDSDFIKTVLLIRKYGYSERFCGKEYIYFYMNGYKYWTMGCPINNCPKTGTILINKATVKYKTPYDKISNQYDDLFKDESSIKENEQIIQMVNPCGRILDIGCGTGLFLEYFKTESYVGIDISNKMLEVLKSKFPAANCINTSLRDFYGGGFDTIVSLFGSASYIEPDILDRAVKLLNSGGKIFFMFYDPDYYPETYKKTGINVKYHHATKENLKKFNNYLIWEYENI